MYSSIFHFWTKLLAFSFLCTLLPPAVRDLTTLIRQILKTRLVISKAERVPLFSRRAAILWEPALAADKSTNPEAMSSISDIAVSKLLFIVVAMTPVGPVFSHPLQYKPEKKTWCHCICVYFYLLSCFFFNDVLWIHTCCLLNAAVGVGDDSPARVERYRRINEGALVANAADDQTAWNIFNLSCEHCVCFITSTLKKQVQKWVQNRYCMTHCVKDIASTPKGLFFLDYYNKEKFHFTIHAVSFVEIPQWALTYLFGFIMSHSMFRDERCTCVIVLQTWYHFLWAKGHQNKRSHSETQIHDLHIHSATDRSKRTPTNFKYVNNKSVSFQSHVKLEIEGKVIVMMRTKTGLFLGSNLITCWVSTLCLFN